uniref:IS1/IS1595 family N-terminal zinc-binding domain-containing protein n=1 Tax=Flavobacterium ajazii TaxID=2692318 RepID=UPI0013D7A1B9|nr:IS1-like element transposase [Flavobacterium ajazii]
MNCPKCKEKKVIKNGRTKNYKQQSYCKMCCHRFIEKYTNQAYKSDINQNIIQLTKEGLGIRSTARILKISATTLLKRIVSIARNITKRLSSDSKTMKYMNFTLALHTRKISLRSGKEL